MCLKEGCQFNSLSEQVFQWAARCYHYDESAVEIMQMSLQEKKHVKILSSLFLVRLVKTLNWYQIFGIKTDWLVQFYAHVRALHPESSFSRAENEGHEPVCR